MNKEKIRREFSKIGLEVEDNEFGVSGYRIKLKFDPTKEMSWKTIYDVTIVGFEEANIRQDDDGEMTVTLIPACEKEFAEYVTKHTEKYHSSIVAALYELGVIIRNYGSLHIANEYANYCKKLRG